MMVDDLCTVNYCHRNRTPLQNIMCLPKEEAFARAYEMAAQNRDTTASYGFAEQVLKFCEEMQTNGEDFWVYPVFL